ncbi:MAG: 4'-phosphopantetheinyl transferase superfamily protein [Candidatus Paraprevotella stercoravium]|uniref:4'-phosphopantetheinyl transferase superfamily protein n=1 Tax=Candidatus Paraprevotella stercoravium TaxID=2838725 RepID=A0A9E2L930_9BACT|nr:4'-phosphopantetheinyl transferase superfamily protein [Candidatus Paraprevotella stercoravium]
MPIIRDISISDFRCCVWQVTETMEELLAMLPDEGHELYEEAQQRFSSPKRRQEFIAVRVLLYQMLPGAVIGYYDNGKPYLAHSCWRISISHTVGYVAVILSDCGEVGVDIEQYGERVCRVASRFINDDERVTGVWKQLLLWSAKETVYKMMNCCEVDFQEHLISGCWRPQEISGPGCKGSIQLQTFHPLHQKTYQVSFETTERFVLTYSFVMDY